MHAMENERKFVKVLEERIYKDGNNKFYVYINKETKRLIFPSKTIKTSISCVS